jgi:outer membrane protein OmpA-like peptidoglycan-associated protein
VTATDFKKIFVAFFLLLGCIALAQDTIDIKTLSAGQAKRFGLNAMKQGDYSSATEYFQQFMKLRPNNAKIAYKLGESYRQVRDYAAAQEWYEKSHKMNPDDALSAYYFALMLKMNGNCEKAKEQFMKFRKIGGGGKEISNLKKQSKNEIAGCDSMAAFIKYSSKINVTHLDSSINKVHVEHSPVMIDTSTLLYSSIRTDKKVYTVISQTDTTVGAYKKFYTAKKKDNKWIYNGEYDPLFNKEGFNSGNGAFSVDGKRFYFTRCKKNWKNQMICAIYVSNKDESGSWSEPVALDKNINNPKYTSTQPAVSVESVKQNEVVYFVSDRPGGKGGLDIWFFVYDFRKKTYGEPKNAGSKINTPADEITPYYDQDSRTLYFSSNGWAGLGGLDIFKSNGEMKKFTSPENVGAPINSSSDDLYFTQGKNKEDGFFVSNRKGGAAIKKNPTCCDDIYSFKRLEYLRVNMKGTVADEKGNPVPGMKVSLYSKTGDGEAVFIKSVETDQHGNYDMGVEAGNNYKLVFEKEKYLNAAHDFNTKTLTESQTLSHNATVKEISDKAYVLSDVHYATDRYELLEASKKAIDTTLLVFLNENPDVMIEISSHTDDQASDAYNNNLSQKRADGVVKYLISKGIAPERLKAHGYGESKPVADNKTEEGRAMNRRTEFKVLGKLPKKEKEYDDKE